jgi:hypothetical protein
MLKCETNTPAVEKKVLTAARKYFRQRKNIHAVFEHGQWYIMREGAGELTENYSVNDAEGIDTMNGFSFERL